MSAELKGQLLDAALAHVPFDGWSEATFAAAARDIGMRPEEARRIVPGGPVELAEAYHLRGDEEMVARMREANLGAMRYSDRVTAAVRFRIEAADKEIVRRGMALFALPQHAARGARLIWGTADRIWNELGDTANDFNWYTKRTSLAGVYGSTVLFWLGDTSEGDAATWGFLDRRIEDVMRVERTKSRLRENPLTRGPMRLAERCLSGIRPPSRQARTDLPGHWAAGDRN